MSTRLRGLATLAIDIGLPMGLYYVLRAAGVEFHTALVVSSFIPGLGVLSDLVRGRRPDRLGLYMTVMMLASAATSVLVQDARLLLAKDGWFTAVAGLWFLASARGERPLAFVFTRFLLEGRIGPNRESWDVLWERLPAFRRIWRVVSVIYGVGLLVDAVVRVVIAYTLPVDAVPGVNTAQYVVWLLLMQVVINVYLVPTGVYSRWSPLYAELRHS
ncbi:MULTISPECIES: VC0807 family protein [unclassified Nonomuraea]|uniref:VC0807 family protein n=1 Tax=unclassified Nonomuraea TaxID=2593643 RepID=UPI0035BF720F